MLFHFLLKFPSSNNISKAQQWQEVSELDYNFHHRSGCGSESCSLDIVSHLKNKLNFQNTSVTWPEYIVDILEDWCAHKIVTCCLNVDIIPHWSGSNFLSDISKTFSKFFKDGFYRYICIFSCMWNFLMF